MSSSTANLGYIQYYFKGMRMKSELAEVTAYTPNNSVIVTRKSDKQQIEFISVLGNWILKTSTNQNNPLYGTVFALSL